MLGCKGLRDLDLYNLHDARRDGINLSGSMSHINCLLVSPFFSYKVVGLP